MKNKQIREINTQKTLIKYCKELIEIQENQIREAEAKIKQIIDQND